MALKGTTVIELTNVKTGEVEVVKEENMITNAIAQLFSNNIEGMLFNVQGTSGISWADYHLPICPNSIGGILLFSDALQEDVNNIFAPSANPCVGYASNNVNSTANVMRGSLNLTESGKITRGYKFVWDFATSQGNGTISAVALTHKRGGVGFVGDTYDAGSRWLQHKNTSIGISGTTSNLYVDAVEVNFEGDYFYTISMNTANELIIKKVRKCFRNIGLNFSLREGGDEILETTTITPTNFINPNASNGNGYWDMIDGKDGHWYGFLCSGNSSGNANVKWIKIKKADYTFTEGTWTLTNARLTSVGYRSGYGGSPSREVRSVIRDGYVYFMHYNRTGVYKVNLNNSADITYIAFGFTSNFNGGDNYGYTYMWNYGDWIMGSDFVIDTNDVVRKTTNNRALSYICTPFFQYGPYALTFGRYSYSSMSVYKSMWLLTPYLASINNLSTSVIKTADKTMKITYTVTETEQ